MTRTSDLKETAKEQAAELGQAAKEHATELGHQAKMAAKEEAMSHADDAKSSLASEAQKAASAAEAAASQFDPNSPQAQAMQKIADHIEDLATHLRQSDVRELAGQASSMARRNPLLFVGGAVIAGFAAARFLKARDPKSLYSNSRDSDPWAAPRNATAHHDNVVNEMGGGRTYG